MLAELMVLLLVGASLLAGLGVGLWRAGSVTGKGAGVVFLVIFGMAGGMALLGPIVGTLAVKKKAREVKAGWNLVPVLVAAMDLPAGTTLATSALEQRSVPEQLVTTSLVKPERLSQVTGKQLVGPMKAGEPLTWLQVGDGLSPSACDPQPK
jgi:Flp pilus assembly protein CpaB